MKLDSKKEFKAHFGIFTILGELFTGKRKPRDLFNTNPMDITFLALVIATLNKLGFCSVFFIPKFISYIEYK